MNKHICIFFCYEQVDIIKTAFDSNYIDSVDFFIVENRSKNSEEIEEYFLTKNLKGYIQFEKNISGNAMNIFLKDYMDLLKEYDYITITDGDYFVYDIKSLFTEIIDNLENSNSIISSGDDYFGNDYRSINRQIGLEFYIDYIKNINILPGYKFVNTGMCFATLKNKDLHFLTKGYILDYNLANWIRDSGGTWCSVLKNLCYHLTWDLYVEGNEYYKWKKSVYPGCWNITEKSNYKLIKIKDK